MTPGNTNPNRYRNKTTLSVAVAALIAAGAGAPAIYQQFLKEREGEKLIAYQDGKKIWTICGGLTRIYGRPVRPDDKLPQAECDRLDAAVQAEGLAGMATLVNPGVWRSMSPAAQAGVASFCWHNIGPEKCRQSTFLRLLNEGRRNEACAQITYWIRDGGKDCRIRSNGCSGQVERRPQEDELCLEGIT